MTTVLGANQQNATAIYFNLSQQFKYNYLHTNHSSLIQENQELFWVHDELEDEELEDELEDVDYLLF